MSKDFPKERANFSFLKSLEASNSFKEFFLMVDSTIALDWRVEFTILSKLFCCGADKNCPLPKATDEEKFDLQNIDLERSKMIFNFLEKYFKDLVTRDDLFLIKNNLPRVYEWYKEISPRLYLGGLDNNHLLRQTKFLIEDFNFKGIASVKLGPTYTNNPIAFRKALDNFKLLTKKYKILGVQVAKPTNEECDSLLKELSLICDGVDIPCSVITVDDEKNEEALQGLVSIGEHEFYEEHAIFLIGTKFYLNQYDHLKNSHNYFYNFKNDIDPTLFITQMLLKKIEIYKERYSTSPESIKSYIDWIVQSVKVNSDFSFIPRFVLEAQSQFYQALKEDKVFNETPYGLLKPNVSRPVPLVSIH